MITDQDKKETAECLSGMRPQQTHLYGMCARAALFFAAFVATSTLLACFSVYLAATSGSATGRQTQDISSQVRCSQ